MRLVSDQKLGCSERFCLTLNLKFPCKKKLKKIGQFKLDNYIIHERVLEPEQCRGGMALGCIKDLTPVWVREGLGNIETLSVKISAEKMTIRCCAAYGS